MKTLKVSSKSKPNLVAGAIARGFIATSGVDLVCIPAFAEIQIEGEERTGIKFIIKEDK